MLLKNEVACKKSRAVPWKYECFRAGGIGECVGGGGLGPWTAAPRPARAAGLPAGAGRGTGGWRSALIVSSWPPPISTAQAAWPGCGARPPAIQSAAPCRQPLDPATQWSRWRSALTAGSWRPPTVTARRGYGARSRAARSAAPCPAAHGPGGAMTGWYSAPAASSWPPPIPIATPEVPGRVRPRRQGKRLEPISPSGQRDTFVSCAL